MAKSPGSNSNFLIILLIVALVFLLFFAFNYEKFQFQISGQNTQVQGTGIVPNSIEAYFCPADNCSQKLISQFDSAKSSIDGAIYSFTLDSIGDSLVSAKKRGVNVRIVMERQQLSEYSELEKLQNAGINVRIDSNPAYMHDKFAVIDKNVVATGSFNWSQNADEKNNENLVIINSQELAQKFETEFDVIFTKSLID